MHHASIPKNLAASIYAFHMGGLLLKCGSQKGLPVKRMGTMTEMSGAAGTRSGCPFFRATIILSRLVISGIFSPYKDYGLQVISEDPSIEALWSDNHNSSRPWCTMPTADPAMLPRNLMIFVGRHC
jgi:hypothetical protein